MENLTILPSASLLRRLGAIFYDSLLLISVLLLATAGFIAVISVESSTRPIFQIYLLLVIFTYFSWFWSHGGQTLGMKAWNLQLQAMSGQKITQWQILKRLVMAMISWLVGGLGFFWVMWDKQGRAWHDLASDTRLVRLP